MIEGKWFAPGTDLSQPLALRRLILNQEADALDPMAWNVVVYREGQPAATGRIWWQDRRLLDWRHRRPAGLSAPAAGGPYPAAAATSRRRAIVPGASAPCPRWRWFPFSPAWASAPKARPATACSPCCSWGKTFAWIPARAVKRTAPTAADLPGGFQAALAADQRQRGDHRHAQAHHTVIQQLVRAAVHQELHGHRHAHA